MLEIDKPHSKSPAEAFANSLSRTFCLIWAICSSTLEDPYVPLLWPLSWQLQPGLLSWVWLVLCQPYQAEATRSPQPKRIHAYQCPHPQPVTRPKPRMERDQKEMGLCKACLASHQ